MRQSFGTAKEPTISRIILLSTALHLLFISLVIIPFKTREREHATYYVTLIEPLQELPAGDNIPAGIEGEETDSKGIKPFLDTGDALRSIERVSKEIHRMRAIKELAKHYKAVEGNQHGIQIKGNNTSNKTSRTIGAEVTERVTGKDSYYGLITNKIRQQWVYPDIETSELEVVVSIKIDREGKIFSQEIEKSSGNPLFDRSAMKAISKASPLPPPIKEMEIGVRFYL